MVLFAGSLRILFDQTRVWLAIGRPLIDALR
jgi:hypothetical protein